MDKWICFASMIINTRDVEYFYESDRCPIRLFVKLKNKPVGGIGVIIQDPCEEFGSREELEQFVFKFRDILNNKQS